MTETVDNPDITFDEVILETNEPPKRKRGRPRKYPVGDATATVESSSDKPKRGRRSRKLNATQVSEGIELVSSIAAAQTGLAFWAIPKDETAPYAPQLAELLNKIPAHYVSGLMDMSGYLIVAYGMYNTLVPRIQMTQQINRQKRAERLREEEGVPVETNPNSWEH